MGNPIGRILLIPKGDYSALVNYNNLDWVRHGGAAWVCKVDGTIGIAPPNPPATSNANWQLLAEDGTVGGWSSIQNKPFETIGAGLNVNLLKELEVAAKNTYIPTGTSSDRPISGQGVADAMTALQNYYTKAEIDSQEEPLAKNGGSKTWNELITNSATYLVAANTNKFYRLTTEGVVDSTNQSLFVTGIVDGEHFSADSHIAVVEESAGVYKYDYFGGGIEPEVYFDITDTASIYTFIHDAINDNSAIFPCSNIVGDKYTNITVSNHTCTVTMATSAARTVRIYVK